MKSLLIIEKEILLDAYYQLCNKYNYEITIIEKNKNQLSLLKKLFPLRKIILLTRTILPRNSSAYKRIKTFIGSRNIFFIEISLNKSRVSKSKANSNAIVNGLGNKNTIVLEKIMSLNHE